MIKVDESKAGEVASRALDILFKGPNINKVFIENRNDPSYGYTITRTPRKIARLTRSIFQGSLKPLYILAVPMKYKNDGILNEVNMTESLTTLRYMISVFSRIIHENGGTLSYEDNILTDIIDYSGDPVYIFTGKDKDNNLLVVVSKSSNVDFIGDTQVFI